MMKNRNFKGLSYYGLQQDEDGNIKLNDYNDVLNARRARVDLLLDSTKQGDVNLSKLNKALNERLIDDKGLSSEFDKEDKEIAQMFSILDNLDNLANIKSEDLLEVSLLLSDLSFIERNIVLNANQSFDLIGLKSLFIEKKHLVRNIVMKNVKTSSII